MRRFSIASLALALTATCGQALGQTPRDAQAARLRVICLSPEVQAGLRYDTLSLMIVALIEDKTGGAEPINFKRERKNSRMSEANFREWARATQAVHDARASFKGLDEKQLQMAIIDYGTKACLQTSSAN
jgi:hypothetical protein